MTIALAAVAIVALAELAVRSSSVRDLALRRLGGWLEESYGVGIEVGQLSLSLLEGSLDAHDVAVRTGDGEPFARVESLQARWRTRSILSGRLRIEEIVLEGPVVDLGRDWPDIGSSESAEEGSSDLPLRVDRIRVVGASVLGLAPSGDSSVTESWSVSDGELGGSLDGPRFAVDSATASLRVDLPAAEALAATELEAEIFVAGEGRIDGEVEVTRLSLNGELLDLEARGNLDLANGRSRVDFRAESDLGLWLTGEPGGPVIAEGALDLGAWKGEVDVRAPELSGALVRRFAGEALTADLELEEMAASLQARLELARENVVRGDLRVETTKGTTRIFEVAIAPRLELSRGTGEPIALTADIESVALPGGGGRVAATASLAATDVARSDSWQILGGELNVEVSDLDRLVGEIARLWPRILPAETIRNIPDLGRLSGRAAISGSLLDPLVDARLEWMPHPGGMVSAALVGRPRGSDLRLTSEASGVALDHFVDEMGGRVEWSLGLQGGMADPSGGAHAAVWGLQRSDEMIADVLDVRVEGDRRRVDWALDGVFPGIGSLEGRGSAVPERTLRTLEGELEITPSRGSALEPFDLIAASLELARGTVEGDLSGYAAGEETWRATTRLPLASLAVVPGLEPLAGLPVERSAGTLEVSWKAASRDWSELLPTTWRSRVEKLSAGSSGRLELDVECPGCSRAAARLIGVATEIDGRVARSEEDLEIALADGVLRLGPWSLRGPGLAIDLDAFADLNRTWRLGAPISDLVVDAGVSLGGDVDSAWLVEALPEEGPVRVVTPGHLRLRARGGWSEQERRAEVTLASEDLALEVGATEALQLSELRAEVEIVDGAVVLESVTARLGGGTMALTGTLPLASPLAAGGGLLRIDHALPVVDELSIPFEMADGRLLIVDGRLSTPDGAGRFDVEAPLSSAAGSVVTVGWDLPPIELAPLLRAFSESQDPESIVIGSRGEARLDLEHLATSSARVTLTDASVSGRGRTTTIDGPAVVSLADGVLVLSPTRLVSGIGAFDLEARGTLASGWSSGDPLAGVLEGVEIVGDGVLDSALLNPFLEGGRAEGAAEVELVVSGSAGKVAGEVRVLGPDVSILYRSPYLTRISGPEILLALDGSRVVVERGSASLNNGPLRVSGEIDGSGRTDLDIAFEEALFSVDYGLLATVDGQLRYTAEPDGTALLRGAVDVERGSLTRDVELDFDLLTELLAPIDLTTTEEDPLALVALDVSVSTNEGVKVVNNLGDLLVRWEQISVSGSVARPVLEGSIEVEPGGLLYAYGQTVRLDRAVIEYPGGELDEPRLELEVTTSLQDPTIARLEGDDPFRRQADLPDSEETVGADVRGDLAIYYGEQVASRLSESVGAEISLRPVLIFGEADPGASLTVSRDFSTHVTVAASIDLTNVEKRTYILEAHEFRTFPGLVGQAFSDDESAYGGVLLQRREFGGSRRASEADLARVRRIRLEAPGGISKRGLKRALGLDKGDPFASRDEFAAEVEMLEYLLRKGYPNARVGIAAVPSGRKTGRVDLLVEIEPGPHVDFVFEGEKIPKSLRRIIGGYYRTDFFESESIESMRRETMKALRARGFLSPEVEVEVDPLDAERPDGDRIVTVRTVGGVRIEPVAPVFESTDEGAFDSVDVEVLAGAFFSPVQRVELAVGLESADARLLRNLEDLGFPEARIVNRYTSIDDKRLTVRVDPGPRRRISELAIRGVDDADRERLAGLLIVSKGDPLRRSALVRSATRLERSLADEGFLDARARAVVGAPAGDNQLFVPVSFDIDMGKEHVVEVVDFEGLRSTRESWLRRVADLEEEERLASGDLAGARTALWRTGLFSSVKAVTEDLGEGRQRVVFDLAERDRFRLAYGVRWSSEDGSSFVFDATDQNFVGRSWTLGLRAMYSSNDKSLRWLTRVPRAGGGRGTVELFALVEEVIDKGIISEVLESTLQYSLPVGERLTVRMYGRYTDTRLSEVDPDPFFPLDERIKSPLLGWQYLYDSRGSNVMRRRGTFFSADLSGSEEFLGGDFRFIRLLTQLNLYRGAGRLLDRDLSWAQSFRVGLAKPFDQELLRSERFFAGGEFSVRGYERESLGPQETLGSIVRPLGGEALLVVNQELHWRIFDDYALLGFFDLGNVWEDPADFGSELFSAVGLGVRAATPVGIIRLDLAKPLDRREGIDPEYAFYFGLGSTF